MILTLIALISFGPGARGAVWWPEIEDVNAKLEIYQDYENPKQFYYVPKTAQLRNSRSDSGADVASHKLFPNRLDPSASATQYRFALQAQWSQRDLQDAEATLGKLYEGPVSLAALPVTVVGITVTQKQAGERQLQLSSPLSIVLPTWTDGSHFVQEAALVEIKGSAYLAEPATSRFVTSEASMHYEARMHYGFPGVRRVLDGHLEVDAQSLVSHLKKRLSIVGYWSRQDIRHVVDRLKDEGEIFSKREIDPRNENTVWNALAEELIEQLFEAATPVPVGLQGRGGEYLKFRKTYEQPDVGEVLLVSVSTKKQGTFFGSMELVGGSLALDRLDPLIRHLCNRWAQFDKGLNRCIDVCEPFTEIYDRKQAACVPAFPE